MVTGEANLEHFNKEELLFIHLLKFQIQQDNYIVSDLITQKGIQKILNCGIGYVSYLLKKNEDRELIFRRKVKVKNKKRRQLGFFLTTNGVDYSIKIKNSYIEYKTNSNIIIIDKPLAKMEIFD